MNASNKMLKYYVGLVVLFIFAVGLIGYTIAAGADSKTDKKTSTKMEAVGNKLDSYTSSKGVVPNSLDELDIKDIPPTITYKKLSDEKYKICVNYKSAGSAFDAGWFSLFGGALLGGSAGDYTPPEEYLDTYNLVYAHKKGETCQTVKPSSIGGSSYKYDDTISESDNLAATNNNSTVPKNVPAKCTSTGDFTLAVHAQVSIVNLTASTITAVTLDDGTGEETIQFDTVTKAYDKTCKEVPIASLKIGDTINYYGYDGSTLVDVIEIQY